MTRWTRHLCVCLLMTATCASARAGLSEEQLAWHWDFETRDAARQATLALAIWLDDDSADPRQWQARVEANRLALVSAARRVPPAQATLADGLFAWLVQSASLAAADGVEVRGLPLPWQGETLELLRPAPEAGRLARMQALMALEAPTVWSELRARLAAMPEPLPTDLGELIADAPGSGQDQTGEADPEASVDESARQLADASTDSSTNASTNRSPGERFDDSVPIDIDGEINAYWNSLMRPAPAAPRSNHPEVELATGDASADTVAGSVNAVQGKDAQAQARSEEEPIPLPQPSSFAKAQAERVLGWTGTEPGDARRLILIDMLQAEVDRARQLKHPLTAVWTLMHALAEVAALAEPSDAANSLLAQVEEFNSAAARELRLIDTDLPVVLALLEDAAVQLAEEEADRSIALGLLSDAYARLALFASDAEFYLDQPVRDALREAMAACTVAPDLVGPIPRNLFEDCLQRLVAQTGRSLGRVELVGDADGPFSSLFLQREMGLVSWQRVAYLDGHLNWVLGASCRPPNWQNPLEWSLLAQFLSRWVAQRPVFFGSSRWRDAVDAFERQAEIQRNGSMLFIDCLTGLGSERLDPVLRLIDRHQQALAALDLVLQESEAAFYAGVTRPQADIDLDADSTQLTSYRPEGLVIAPCEEAEACGVAAELPVSRALLGEFPNAYLLADQLELGRLNLCYRNVRWEDRQARAVPNDDPRVANYFGHLSFDLEGTFERAGRIDTVFRHRLRSNEARHYLFASSAPEVLEMSCPNALAGQPVASQLAADHLGLVPDRLTYFVSQPATPQAEILANWDQGAEWRDWFVTQGRVVKDVISDGVELAVEVDAELDRLARQRDRELSRRLLSRLNPAQDEPDALAVAMSEVAENTALMRRVLEIHYPRVIRQDPFVRGLLAGEGGLLNRDRVRQLSDTELVFDEVVSLGQERLERLRERWLELPVELRESGQVSPELDFAAERLAELRRLSRSWLEDDESLPDP